MTRNEAHDRADDIWADSLLAVDVNGDGTATIETDPRMARRRIGARCSQFAKHALDVNGHATCHTECEKYEQGLPPYGPTFTATGNDGKVWYAKQPHGNLMGQLPLGARPTSWGSGDEPWDGAQFILGSGRTIVVTMDREAQ